MNARLALTTIGVVVLAAFATFAIRRERAQPPAATTPPPAASVRVAADGTAIATQQDAEQVFQKAFWRRPASDDRILHAERREWSTAGDGVQRWQWFIVVKPGAALTAWLATNPFALATTATPKPPADPAALPAWFPKTATGLTAQQNAEGHLTLLFSAAENLLYATDSGAGFAPAK